MHDACLSKAGSGKKASMLAFESGLQQLLERPHGHQGLKQSTEDSGGKQGTAGACRVRRVRPSVLPAGGMIQAFKLPNGNEKITASRQAALSFKSVSVYTYIYVWKVSYGIYILGFSSFGFNQLRTENTGLSLVA